MTTQLAPTQQRAPRAFAAGTPELYYAFAEGSGTSVADGSGHGHTGTIGGAGWDATRGYFFTPAEAGITFLNAPIALGTRHTISAKVEMRDGQDEGVLVGGPAGDAPLYPLQYTNGFVGYTLLGERIYVDTGASFTPGSYIAAVREGTTVTFYRDGLQVGASQTLSSNAPVSVSRIGAYEDGTQKLVGYVDELQIFSTALSAAEIAALHGAPPPASVPEVVQANSAGNASAAALSVAITPTGADRLLLVGIATQDTSKQAIGVTFNRTEALTKVVERDFGTARLELWELVDPRAVAGNVDVVMNGATSLAIGAAALTGIHPVTPHGAPVDNGGTSNLSTVNVASAGDELVLGLTSISLGTGITEDAGQTNVVEQQSASGGGHVTLGMSTKAGAPSATLTWAVDTAKAGTPELYYAFAEGSGTSVADGSGHGHTGTIGGAGWDATRGYFFTPAEAGITFLNTPIALGTRHTVSAKVEMRDGQDEGVVVGGAAGDAPLYPLQYTNGFIGYQLRGERVYVDTGASFTPGSFIAAVRDGTTVTFYRDGVQVGAPQTLSSNAPVSVSRIGAYEDGTQKLIGYVKELQIFSTALSAADIAVLHGVPPQSVPELYYAFAEGSGTSVADSSGHGHTGTIGGAGWDATRGYFFTPAEAGITFLNTPIALGTRHTVSAKVEMRDGQDEGVLVGGPAGDAPLYPLQYTNGFIGYQLRGERVYVDTGASFTPGSFIAAVRDGTTVTFYRDGVQVGAPQTLSSNAAVSVSRIGAYEDGTQKLIGYVKELQIFSTALSAADIAALHAARPSASVPDWAAIGVSLKGAPSTGFVPDTPPANGILVAPNQDVRTAINAAPAGSTLLFLPGARYRFDGIAIPNKAITLRTSATLPDRRITPADAPALPVFYPGQASEVLNLTNATDVVLSGIQIESRTDGLGDMIICGNSDRITIDRLLLVAGPAGQKRGIRGNGRNIVLTRSHIANIFSFGQDSQAFAAWEGAGPYHLLDNYLEAASENVMFGGSDTANPVDLCGDITVVGNTFRKRPKTEWVPGDGHNVKNILEFKIGNSATVTDNDFADCWTDGQNGFGIVIKSVNQDGGSSWNVTKDVLFERNILTNTQRGINVQGYDYERGDSLQTTRITIRNNRIVCDGECFQVGAEIDELTIDGNEIIQGFNLMTMYKGAVRPTLEGGQQRLATHAVLNLAFTNNRSLDVPYGIKGPGTASGTPTLDEYSQTYIYTGNILITPTAEQLEAARRWREEHEFDPILRYR